MRITAEVDVVTAKHVCGKTVKAINKAAAKICKLLPFEEQRQEEDDMVKDLSR